MIFSRPLFSSNNGYDFIEKVILSGTGPFFPEFFQFYGGGVGEVF